MGQMEVDSFADPDRLRLFMKHLLNDLRALEQLIADDWIESDVCRIGAEQEMFLVDSNWRPAPVSVQVLEQLDDPAFTTELARFNLEANIEPLIFKNDVLSQLEVLMKQKLAAVSKAADHCGAKVVLCGILPTIRKTDLGLDNMTPVPRYRILNEAMCRLRGSEFEVRFSGTDDLIMRHDSVMLESCNTSCQFHFQVSAESFPRIYNMTQAVAGAVLAIAANSPLLFGQRLWRETRIALFQQAVDTRQPGPHLEERSARVRFGSDWVSKSVLEIFREDIARFRAVLGTEVDEDPFEVMAAGRAPKLKALQLHNGTVYRWMRPCYGVRDGKAHLRIENRILPSGPTLADEIANATFWIGLVSELAAKYDDITALMEFDDAKYNFVEAARSGLGASLCWLEGKRMPAPELITGHLLPMAQSGLARRGIASADIDRYLGIIEARASSGRTGAQWQLDSMTVLKHYGKKAEQLSALTAAMWTRQQEGEPVHAWSDARIIEAGGWKQNFMRVEQYMTTDLFTVHEDEVIDLVANLMDWEKIRHVPVENEKNQLVGLISYRQLLRFLAQDLPHGRNHPVPVKEIMQPDPITVSPDTSTLEAIDIMRREKVACLPVVKDQRLVGIITERDFMGVAADLFEASLRAR